LAIAYLLRLATDRYLLLMGCPAWCADTKTLENWTVELSQTYAAVGQETTCDNEPLQYADLAEWQNELLESDEAEIGKAFWRNCNVSDAVRLNLPLAKPSPPTDEFCPQVLKLTLSSELTDKIAAIAPPRDFLLASWLVLFWRLSDGDFSMAGLACDGRNDEDLDSALGLLSRYVPLQIQFDDRDSFDRVIERVRDAAEQAERWQDSFAWNDEQPSSFFPVSFEFNALPIAQRSADVSFELRGVCAYFDRFALQLSVKQTATDLTLEFHYDRDRFDPEAISRLSGHFHAFIASATHHCQQPIARLNLLSDRDRYQLLHGWNDTQTPDFQPQCIHRLFEQQVESHRDRVAAVFESQQLTYGEFNRRANQLARFLQQQGIGPESVVGVYLERSLDFLVAMLAVLKAGGAYLPLDPQLPPSGIAIRLQAARPTLILTQSALTSSLPPDRRSIALDAQSEAIAREATANPDSPVAVSNLAYVLFTSGSTGEPKGVAVEHRQIANYLHGIQAQLDLPDAATYAIVSSFAVDLGHTAVFPALCGGGCLHVIARERAIDPNAFAAYCQQHPIDCLKIVPSHFAALLAADRPEAIVPRLRLVLGGEAASWQLCDRVGTLAPHCRILNHYGPTETTVGVLSAPVNPADRDRTGAVTLGRPLPHTRVYLLDRHLNPVPVGIPGELYIGGDGVSRGYLNRGDLNGRSFLADPFSSAPGARLYRTGDLARYLDDGTLEFLGRRDRQVKLRGFRVELGEIEAALQQHPEVRQSAATVREGNPPLLVGYVATANPVNPDEVRHWVERQLPEYMVPAAFVTLRTLPLAPNGKIDFAALPDPEVAAGEDAIAPRTPVEEILVQIWQQVLGVPKAGIRDNFFELGGHSLLATQTISRIRRAFDLELPLSEIFDRPTVTDLADRIECALHQGDRAVAPIEPVPRDRPLPLSFAQQRLWSIAQLDPDTPAYNIPLAVRLQGSLDIAALEASLNALVQRHEVWRTAFPTVDERPVQAIAPHLSISLPVTDLRSLPQPQRLARARELMASEVRQPFHLATAPLLRVRLFQLDGDDFVLLFVSHHIIFDAWSRAIVIGELAAVYRAQVQQQTPELSELPIQYADFAAWQRQWLQGEVLERQRTYWQQQLRDVPGVLELPSDRPRPAVQSGRGASEFFQLSPELSEDLKRLSQRQDATPFMTLLAAFDVLLYRYTGQTDLVVGSPVANRSRTELEGLVGFFTNTLVLRADVSGNPTFEQLLERVRTICLQAYRHQDLPFEQLVELLPVERSLSHHPLFQVMFALRNTPTEPLDLPGLRATPERTATATATFDLTLLFEDTDAGFKGGIEYSTDLFEPDTIRRAIACCNLPPSVSTRQPKKSIPPCARGRPWCCVPRTLSRRYSTF
jgi:amino acid adenylation domain-containing protein